MFEGTIPTEIGKLNELQRLNLRRNLNITGTIPTELGKCKSLKNFALESSRVEGTIPPQLFDATKLEWLFLLDNKLIGTIPSNLGQLQNLVTCKFSCKSIEKKLNSHFPLSHIYHSCRGYQQIKRINSKRN